MRYTRFGALCSAFTPEIGTKDVLVLIRRGGTNLEDGFVAFSSAKSATGIAALASDLTVPALPTRLGSSARAL